MNTADRSSQNSRESFQMRNAILEELIKSHMVRCRLACEAEAESMGFTGALGGAVYDGCLADDLQGWSEDQYMGWVIETSAKFGRDDWMKLYNRVSEIMGQYGDLIKTSIAANPSLIESLKQP